MMRSLSGSPKNEVGGTKYGSAFLYKGSPTGIKLEGLVRIDGDKQGSEFGAAVSSAGDVNGDHYPDIIIGAPLFHDPDGIGANGKAFVYHGSSGGISLTPSWSMIGEDEAEFGGAVAGVGDVNGDGFDDVLVGARLQNTETVTGVGAVFLYYGSNAGLSNTPAWSATGWQTSHRLGFALAGLGDLNNDGYKDFAVTAPGYTPNVGTLDYAGAVYVWYGSNSGPSPVANWTALGTQDLEQFGWSVSGAGDVDGNGYPDLVVGSRGYNSTFVFNVGGAYIFTNQGGMLRTTPFRIYSGPHEGSGYGMSVAGLGDLNNDGYADVGVGAPFCDAYENDNEEGCVFVYRGSTIGLLSLRAWLGWGGKADTEFGMAVGGAGDVNGDGYDDLIIGAPRFFSDDKNPYGKAAVYHGAFAEATNFYWSFLPVVNK